VYRGNPCNLHASLEWISKLHSSSMIWYCSQLWIEGWEQYTWSGIIG
jgi:hypothetical protein